MSNGFVVADENPAPRHPLGRLAARLEELRDSRHLTGEAYRELSALLEAHDWAVAAGVFAEIATTERTYGAQNNLVGEVGEHQRRLIEHLESHATSALAESRRLMRTRGSAAQETR